MARSLILPSIQGGRELRRTAALLRAVGREDLVRDVGNAVKAEAQPTLNDVRASARRVRITGERTDAKRKFRGSFDSKHLRDRMAEATTVEVRTSDRTTRISFVVQGSRMGSAKVLPRYIDGGARGATTTGRGKGSAGWRHPIMGKRSRWAVSVGEPWFFPPIKDHLPKIREHISVVLDEIVEKVERS